MAAAYAALRSLEQTIAQIQNHPRPPISLDKTKTKSLTDIIIFLLHFLENYSFVDGQEADALEARMADAAYAAEDLIESHIVHQIQALSGNLHYDSDSSSDSSSDPSSDSSSEDLQQVTEEMELIKTVSGDGVGGSLRGSPSSQGLNNKIQAGAENLNSIVDLLYKGLQKVTDEMELIKNEVIEIQIQNLGIRKFSSPGSIGGSSPSSLGHTDTSMVGCDDVVIDVMDKLTGQHSSWIIPIVGMGGIGKTTLAKNIYVNPLIVEYFDLRCWATISQDYDSKEILFEILISCLITQDSRETLRVLSEDELGEKLHKTLYGRRYLVVMDDMWNIDAWNKVRFYFPDNGEGSRIMITTRLSDLASELTGSCGLQKMSFLNNDCSWNLFCKTVFEEDGSCPPKLEEIGQRITKSCKGLPLSIKVIGGLLSQHKESHEYWEYVIGNFNAVLNSEDDELCLKILRLSYMELPMHLKHCFLYMAVFREDGVIPKSKLIKLWVAEGFLKPITGKIMEMVAEEYLRDLLNRNLILAHKTGITGNIKSFKIHDLLRELCIKEAEKSKFMCTRREGDPTIQQDIQSQRRIGLHPSMRNNFNAKNGPFQSSSLRSFIRDSEGSLRGIMLPSNSRLLDLENHFVIPHFYHLWNIQTLAIRYHAKIDIWEMPQLRHVKCDYGFHLLDPTPHHEEGGDLLVVLENLQTLKTVENFKWSEDVVKRIPNIKKLAIKFIVPHREDYYCLHNLCKLQKLETLCCICCDIAELESRLMKTSCLGPPEQQESLRSNTAVHLLNTAVRTSVSDQGLTLPHSLKKLTLDGIQMSWEEVGKKIGSLPHLQVLKLRSCLLEREWETVEGQFRRLKYLEIQSCYDLIQWRTYRTHFPCLVKLFLLSLDNLEEIPREIGNITTLESIEVICCGHSVWASAEEIVKEQHELGNESLRLESCIFYHL